MHFLYIGWNILDISYHFVTKIEKFCHKWFSFPTCQKLRYMKHIMLGWNISKIHKTKNGNIYFIANISRCSIRGIFDVCITVAFLHPFLPFYIPAWRYEIASGKILTLRQWNGNVSLFLLFFKYTLKSMFDNIEIDYSTRINSLTFLYSTALKKWIAILYKVMK